MLKILVIDEWLPWPLETGKKIRTYNLLSRLASKHEILYIAHVDIPGESDSIAAMNRLNIRVIPVQDVRIRKRTLHYLVSAGLNLLSSVPFPTVYNLNHHFTKKLQEVIFNEKPDLIHCEWSNLVPLLEYAGSLPKTVTAHNAEAEVWRRFAKTGVNPLLRFIAHQQATKI